MDLCPDDAETTDREREISNRRRPPDLSYPPPARHDLKTRGRVDSHPEVGRGRARGFAQQLCRRLTSPPPPRFPRKDREEGAEAHRRAGRRDPVKDRAGDAQPPPQCRAHRPSCDETGLRYNHECRRVGPRGRCALSVDPYLRGHKVSSRVSLQRSVGPQAEHEPLGGEVGHEPNGERARYRAPRREHPHGQRVTGAISRGIPVGPPYPGATGVGLRPLRLLSLRPIPRCVRPGSFRR